MVTTFYIIGEIKELCGNYYFKAETDKQTAYLTHTDENISWSSLGGAYATVSFYNDALNRRIMVSWMIDISASSLSGKTWNGMLSSFMETTLKTVNNQIQLVSYPVEEYETLRRETVKTLENSTVTDTNAIKGINSDIFDCEISFDAGQNGILKFVFAESGDKNSIILYDCENNILTLDLSNSGKIVKSVLSAKIVPSNGKITLRIMVDRSIVEIYANGGENVIQSLYYAPEGADILSLTSEGDVILNSFEMYSMDSCWEEVK